MRRELELLREKMRETGVDACLIPTSDFHGSEYEGDYFNWFGRNSGSYAG